MTLSVTLDAPHFGLEIDRTLAAPRKAVWRCWTEPDLFKQWFCPAPWRVTAAELDPPPGGRMNSVMEGPNGEKFENVGMFLDAAPEERLVFTDAFAEGFVPRADAFMTGRVQLSDAGPGETRMVWGARHASEDQRKQHIEMGFEQGWKTASDQLETLAKSL